MYFTRECHLSCFFPAVFSKAPLIRGDELRPIPPCWMLLVFHAGVPGEIVVILLSGEWDSCNLTLSELLAHFLSGSCFFCICGRC